MSKDNVFLWGLEQLKISITKEQIEAFEIYYKMLVEKNKVMNLTAITEWEDVVVKHFLDSLALVSITSLNEDLSLLDLGTGAGFPGIPLKITFPNLKIVLLDSLNKRILFLQEVIETLGMTGIAAIHGRAEEFAKKSEFRGSFDLCVSRAVANLSTLSEYCIPFVRKGGYFIPYKSNNVIEEVEGATKAIQLLGGKLEEVYSFILPGTDMARSFVKIKKTMETPNKYPRSAGKPSKEPL